MHCVSLYENTWLKLRCYPDDETRQQWLEDVPDYVLPPHEDPSYDSDRHGEPGKPS